MLPQKRMNHVSMFLYQAKKPDEKPGSRAVVPDFNPHSETDELHNLGWLLNLRLLTNLNNLVT